MEYKINNDELMHYGVPGMKWGVRKADRFKRTEWNGRAVMKARKDYKRSKNRNPNAINAIKKNNISNMHRATTRSGEYRAYAKGKQAVLEAKLLQAGYTKKSAQAGAKWMYDHGWNMDWSDGNDYARMKK